MEVFDKLLMTKSTRNHFVLTMLILLVSLLTSCAVGSGDINRLDEGELDFEYNRGDVIEVESRIPAEYNNYRCFIVPCQDSNNWYTILTHDSSTGQFEDELIILGYDADEKEYNTVYAETDASIVVQKSVTVGNDVYALIYQVKTGSTELCSFKYGEKKLIASYAPNELTTICNGYENLPIYRYVGDEIWLELYDPKKETIDKCISGLNSYSPFENPCINRYGWTAVVLGDSRPYIMLVDAKDSAHPNKAAYTFVPRQGVLPARIIINEKYIVFTDGYGGKSDIYFIDIGELFEPTVTVRSKDIPVSKVTLEKNNTSIFSLCIRGDILYVLNAPDELDIINLKKQTVTSHMLSKDIWGMEISSRNLFLYDVGNGDFTIVPINQVLD